MKEEPNKQTQEKQPADPSNDQLLEALKACIESLAGYRREMCMLIGIGSNEQPCDAEKAAAQLIADAESLRAVQPLKGKG